MIKYIRNKNIVATLHPKSGADTQTFPSNSAAKRFVRELKLPLGQVRKLDSLKRELGDKRVAQMLTQGTEVHNG
jgi:hypothetical protein